MHGVRMRWGEAMWMETQRLGHQDDKVMCHGKVTRQPECDW
jgi:hypothetical protein